MSTYGVRHGKIKKYLAFLFIILYKKHAMTRKLPAKRRSSRKRGKFDRYIIGGIIIALIGIVFRAVGPAAQLPHYGGEKTVCTDKDG